jgi:hypothetical protein
MSTQYLMPTGDARARAAGLFVAIRQIDALQGTRDDRRRRIGLDRLYAYAVDPDREDAELVNALRTNPNLGEAFQRILNRTALHRMPRVAAASPGVITSRDGTGCRIRFQESRAEPDQTYIIIELLDTEAPPPGHMFVVGQGGQYTKFVLPASRNGVVQFLVERDSALLASLLDIKTEVFLK